MGIEITLESQTEGIEFLGCLIQDMSIDEDDNIWTISNQRAKPHKIVVLDNNLKAVSLPRNAEFDKLTNPSSIHTKDGKVYIGNMGKGENVVVLQTRGKTDSFISGDVIVFDRASGRLEGRLSSFIEYANKINGLDNDLYLLQGLATDSNRSVLRYNPMIDQRAEPVIKGNILDIAANPDTFFVLSLVNREKNKTYMVYEIKDGKIVRERKIDCPGLNRPFAVDSWGRVYAQKYIGLYGEQILCVFSENGDEIGNVSIRDIDSMIFDRLGRLVIARKTYDIHKYRVERYHVTIN